MRHDLEEWANAKGIKPAFLFLEETPINARVHNLIKAKDLLGVKNGVADGETLVSETESPKGKGKLSQSQIDKGRFQGQAAAMWDKNKNLTQAEIIRSGGMEFFRLSYKGKNTLRDWLREIDPRPIEKRRGAPKKYLPLQKITFLSVTGICFNIRQLHHVSKSNQSRCNDTKTIWKH